MAAGMLAEEGCLSPPVSCDGFLPVLGIDLAYAGFSGWLKAKTFFCRGKCNGKATERVRRWHSQWIVQLFLP